MYYLQKHKIINQIYKVFRLLGLWTEDGSMLFSKTGLKFFYLVSLFSLALTMGIGGLLSGDWNESIFLIGTSIGALVTTVKLIYILWKKEEICALIEDTSAHYIADYKEFVKVNEKVKNLMTFSLSFLLMSFVTCVVLVIFRLPVLFSGQRLPFDIWFPFDWKHNALIHWIAYLFVVTGITIILISISLNVILWYLMMNCAIKYQILGSQFRNMFLMKPAIENRKISKVEMENLFLQELIGLIKSHQKIKNTVDRFTSFFENLFFIQITTAGISICGSLYALAFSSHNENFVQSMLHNTVLLHCLFDIFMVMYLGNEITLSSDLLSYSLFESNWMDQSESCKKYIIILAEVFKRSQELRIGKLYPLNMETFTSIVKTAYSMFNILQNLK